jgi:hydroxymethylbilane synthase
LKPLRIGTRGSALALWQAEHVSGRLRALGYQTAIEVIVTTGDRVQDRRLDTAGGKGAFLKEIEEAMLAGHVDLAVHSLKDVPVLLPDGLHLVAALERADPRDALLTADGAGLGALRPHARVGTTSLRRRALLRDARGDVQLEDLRGNVDTRVRRLREGRFDAIVLAMAGLARLGRAGEVTEALDAATFVPAPGQGAIVLECRIGDRETGEAAAQLHHEATARAVTAERAFLRALGGGCNVPLGAHATAEGGSLRLRAFVASPEDRGELIRGEAAGEDPATLGRTLADQFVRQGALERMGR